MHRVYLFFSLLLLRIFGILLMGSDQTPGISSSFGWFLEWRPRVEWHQQSHTGKPYISTVNIVQKKIFKKGNHSPEEPTWSVYSNLWQNTMSPSCCGCWVATWWRIFTELFHKGVKRLGARGDKEENLRDICTMCHHVYIKDLISMSYDKVTTVWHKLNLLIYW